MGDVTEPSRHLSQRSIDKRFITYNGGLDIMGDVTESSRHLSQRRIDKRFITCWT